MRWRYRLWQWGQLLRRRPLSREARIEVAAVLSEAEMALFNRFGASDQWHSYRVFCMLRESDPTNPALLKAALLHDVGKTLLPLTIWERALIVLLGRLLPERTRAWGSKEINSYQLSIGNYQLSIEWWRRPFVVKEQHPAWGAAMAEAAGSEPLVVTLIGRHQDELPEVPETAEDQLLARLQWADDLN